MLDQLGGDVLVSLFSHIEGDKQNSNDEHHFAAIAEYSRKTSKYICTENLPRAMPKTKHQDPEELVEFLSRNDCHMTYDTTHAATRG